MNFSKVLPLLFVLVVAAAGCLHEGGSSGKVSYSQNDGVKFVGVNVSTVNFESVGSEENSADIDFSVQNVGGRRAHNVTLQVFGHSWNKYKSADKQPFWFTMGSGTLDAPNPTLKTPSIPEQVSLSLKTPTLIQDQQTYTWTSRLYYRYSGLASGESEALSDAEFRRQQKTQTTTFDNDITKAMSGGPIQMKVLAQNPIIVKQSGIPLLIEFANTGGGRVFVTTNGAYHKDTYGILGTQDYDKVYIINVTSDIGTVECPVNQAVRISTPLRCRITVTPNNLNVPKSTVNIRAEIVYGYQVDKEFPVAVRRLFGEDESGATGGGSGSTGGTTPGAPPSPGEQPPAPPQVNP